MEIDYKELVINSYKDFTSNYDISGFKNLIDHINSSNPSLVIDAGCGNNIFKNYIRNIIGFDVRSNIGADYVGTYEEMDNVFEANSADFIICFDSLGFGNYSQIQTNAKLMTKWLKADGLIFVIERSNKNVTENDRKKYPLKVFWDNKLIDKMTKFLELELFSNPVIEGNKLNWVWRK